MQRITLQKYRLRSGSLSRFARTLAGITAVLTTLPGLAGAYQQATEDLIGGEIMAVAYSGFRKGQHPDRGDGAINPSREQTLEDLRILEQAGFRLIRMYDSREKTELVLQIIREEELPIRVLLGMWLDAEISNHEGCSWLTEPIPAAELAGNKQRNLQEIMDGIRLANKYREEVIAVNVGNEALVDWNDHMVPVETVIKYVRRVKAAIEQPVTVADNYVWWRDSGAALAAELDFIGVHTYPIWEEKTVQEGLAYTIENIEGVYKALPDSQIAILEAGWATTSNEFPEQANEANQIRYYQDIQDWAKATNTTVFFFEAFDEPWKGDPNNPQGAEKHWGIYFEDRSPKAIMKLSAD